MEIGYQLPPAHLGVYLRLALLEQEVSQDTVLSQGKSPDGAICLLSPQLEEEFTSLVVSIFARLTKTCGYVQPALMTSMSSP